MPVASAGAEMAGAPEQVTDVRLFLPETWWAIPLTDGEAMRAAVRKLVHRQFTGIEDHPVMQSDLRRALLAQANEAAANGGRLLALNQQVVDGLPVPASLVLTWIDLPPTPDALPGEMLMDLKDRLHPDPDRVLPAGHSLDLGKLPPGDALRRVHLQDSPIGAPTDPLAAKKKDAVRSLLADYWLERPDLSGMVHLAFSSPIVPLREVWLELWDAVVGALRWVSGPPSADMRGAQATWT